MGEMPSWYEQVIFFLKVMLIFSNCSARRCDTYFFLLSTAIGEALEQICVGKGMGMEVKLPTGYLTTAGPKKRKTWQIREHHYSSPTTDLHWFLPRPQRNYQQSAVHLPSPISRSWVDVSSPSVLWLALSSGAYLAEVKVDPTAKVACTSSIELTWVLGFSA